MEASAEIDLRIAKVLSASPGMDNATAIGLLEEADWDAERLIQQQQSGFDLYKQEIPRSQEEEDSDEVQLKKAIAMSLQLPEPEVEQNSAQANSAQVNRAQAAEAEASKYCWSLPRR